MDDIINIPDIHGVYRIWWKDGGCSVAAIGTDSQGNRWYMPANKARVIGYDWKIILWYELIEIQDMDRPLPPFILMQELKRLKELNESLCERIAKQSELLSKKAERETNNSR